MLRAVLAAVLALVAVFVVTTRSELGREGLRRSLEYGFARQFAGTLTIERLTGNVVGTFFADGVTVRDAAGRTVAHADRVEAYPTVWGLLSNTLELRRLVLVRPDVRLARDTANVWNVARVFARPNRASGAPKWSLGAPEVRVEGGRISVENRGAVPATIARGDAFDALNARYEGISGTATVVWSEAGREVDVETLRLRIPSAAWTLDDLSGQYAETDSTRTLAGVRLRAGRTDVRLNVQQRRGPGDRPGSLPPGGLRPGGLRPAAARADTARVFTPGPRALAGRADVAGTLDFDDARRLVPRLPLASLARVDVRVDGDADRVAVERLRVETGASRLDAAGTFVRTADSLAFEVRPLAAFARGADLRALVPAFPARAAALVGPETTVRLAAARFAAARGAARRFSARAEGEVLQADARVAGRAAFVNGVVPRWALAADVQNVDAARFDGRLIGARAVRLNGRVEASGIGAVWAPDGWHTAEVAGRVALARSVVAGRALDSLRVEGTLAEGAVRAAVAVAAGGGRARGRVDAQLVGATSADVEATFQNFDVDALAASGRLRTRLDGTATLALRGFSLTAFDADRTDVDLALDLPTAAFATDEVTRTLRGLRATLTRTPDGLGRLDAEASGVRVRLDGTLQPGALRAHAAFYAARLSGPWRAAFARRLDSTVVAAPLAGVPEGTPGALPVALTGEVSVSDPAVLAPFVPAAASDALGGASNLFARFSLASGVGGLSANTFVTLDSLRTAKASARGVRLTADVEDDGVEPPRLVASVRADSARAGARTLAAPALDVRFVGTSGRVALRGRTGPGGESVDGLLADATLDLLPDRARLTLSRLAFRAGPFRLANAEPAALDLYADALAVRSLALTGTGEGGATQRLELSGIVSARATDTLAVHAEGLSLAALTRGVPTKAPVGGTLSADVDVTGVLAQPELTGRVEATGLTYGAYRVGRLVARSFFRPGADDVTLDLALEPETNPAADTVGAFPVRENRLTVGGTFRLPRADGTDAGALDLRLDTPRLDAFFFDYLFPDVVAGTTGTIVGGGTIRGTPRRPLFAIPYTVAGASFRVPRFGLAFTASGGGAVDERGIGFDGLTIRDATGGSAVVAGSILFNDYRYFAFDVRARLSDLQLINVPASNDLPLYGRLWASGDATLDGPINAARLRASNAVTSGRSELFLPIRESVSATDPGFIVFADSAGRLPDLRGLTTRTSVLRKPLNERAFIDGLEMELNVTAPRASTLNLVVDPLRGDVMRAQGGGRLQILRREGEFEMYGALAVEGGDYLFTAGDLFVRRFRLDGGTITWDGDPTNARLDVTATYRTRASTAGLASGLAARLPTRLPLVVRLAITERIQAPAVALALEPEGADQDEATRLVLETAVNDPARQTEYATSVLLTNSFLLTTGNLTGGPNEGGNAFTSTGNQLAFTSLSQLVAAQLNRYLSNVLPGVELNLGLQGERAANLDLTYGIALRLLDERLIIRGEGVLSSEDGTAAAGQQGLQGEFVVEVRLSPSVSVEAFYRRENALVSVATTNTTGVSLSYRTQFPTWRRFLDRLLGRRRAEPEAVPVAVDE